MSNFSFNIHGQDMLMRKLRQNAEKSAIKEIVKRHGAQMQVKAQELAPVDTGNLKRAIELENTGMTATVTANAEYAGYQEFGTRFMSAQPFMGPAWRKERPLFISDLWNLVR